MNAKNCHFVVFSDDWGEHPSSCQHLFLNISKSYTVTWVNTIGMRPPKFSVMDLQKSIKKLHRMFQKKNKYIEQKEKLGPETIIQPFMLPWQKIPGIRRMNAISVISAVRKELKNYPNNEVILVTTVPNACDYIGHFNEDLAVYYCVDDFTEWPGLDKNYIKDLESELLSHCDALIATSEKLLNRLKFIGKPLKLLTHGVNTEMFTRLPDKKDIVLQNIKPPRVGYYGLFDKRSDQELLLSIALELPMVSFVIIGKVEYCLPKLRRLENIYFIGPVKYERLPSLIKGLEILILPYKVNELTQSIYPLKLKEYILTGKPVICSPLPEVKQFEHLINIAETERDWINNISCQLYKKHKKKSIEYIKNAFIKEQWEYKSEEFVAFCLENLKK